MFLSSVMVILTFKTMFSHASDVCSGVCSGVYSGVCSGV